MVHSTYWAHLALALTWTGVFGESAHPRANERANKPNVLVIMTDDQDLRLDSLSVQPNIQNLFGNQGVTYPNYYCTVAWCCPSRVNFFTGKAAHNTNVTSLTPPYGGWPKFQQQKLDKNYLPVWLQAAGLNTYYVGKFMNGFAINNLAKPSPPAGWTNSSFLLDPYTYDYLNSHWTTEVNAESKADVAAFKGIHTSTVLQTKALAMIEEAAASGNQWYMQVAPVAPHLAGGPGVKSSLPVLPPGYNGQYNNTQIPKTANFNPDVPSGESWVYNLPQLTQSQLDLAQQIYFHRLANLQYIDTIVANLIQKLSDLGQLNNTYIVYTTDNGFHIGNHRLPAGKRCPYEEDINIPFFIRGPDVPQGVTTNYTTSHTDMAPTILQMLGVPTRPDFDGKPIPYTSDTLNSAPTNLDLVNVEFWDGGPKAASGEVDIDYETLLDNEGLTSSKGSSYYNNTYKALRMFSGSYSFLYTTWCTGAHEFYDMVTDTPQMQNRLANPPQGTATQYYGRNESFLYTRLNALLMVTKGCKEDTCRDPWSALFPGGQVDSLQAAMASQYDSFFAGQPQVSFTGCPNGHIIADEGPQNVIPYSS